MPPHLVKKHCPPYCTAATCDDIFNHYAPLYDACTDDTCRATIQSQYETALTNCQTWTGGA